MTFLKTLAAAGLLALTACSGPADLYSVPRAEATDRVAVSFRSIEVREVSLPSYAADDAIAVQGPGGVLLTDDDVRWADNPERAVSLELTRHLSALTGVRVASEPWPFETFPEATVEVRFETLLAGADGIFRGDGQYFVSTEDGARDHAHLFDLAVPFDLSGGPQAIASARGQLVLELADIIARDGLR